jgi:DNA-damage-inducible protein J
MNKVATVNARIEPNLKIQAEMILDKIGVSTAEAIRIFYSQICLQNGLPFDVKIPNKKTMDAIEELEAGHGERYKTMKDVWDSLDDA